jgi:uncharacterized protein
MNLARVSGFAAESIPVSIVSPDTLSRFLERVELFMARVEASLPTRPPAPDWQASIAFRWRRTPQGGWLQGLGRPHLIHLVDLTGIDEQKERVMANTEQFLAGRPANNVLLTGTRGSGKSSIVKGVLDEYATRGLRLIEVDKSDLADLPDIIELIADRPERFIVFCDDLSFESGETGYKALKVALDGSLAAAPDNLLIYATSNRRHLLPEYFSENLEAHHVDGEVHPGEATEEKISLSERFGLWVSFYPFDQDEYLAIVYHWLAVLGCTRKQVATAERPALNWALARGSRSGRVAWQFAKDWAAAQVHRK